MRRKKTLVETLQSPHPVSGEAESSEGGEGLSWSGQGSMSMDGTGGSLGVKVR